jgi:putative oxidoreductase
LVGSVFLSEGIQKFLYPPELAAGRFTKIGIPAPETMGHSSAGAKLSAAHS